MPEVIKSFLLFLAWRDGYANGANAMLAVTLCVRNRVKDNDWMTPIWDLLEKGVPMTRRMDLRDPLVKQVWDLLDSVIDGSRSDKLVAGATRYLECTHPNHAEIHNMFERVATIGTLSFFKEDQADASV